MENDVDLVSSHLDAPRHQASDNVRRVGDQVRPVDDLQEDLDHQRMPRVTGCRWRDDLLLLAASDLHHSSGGICAHVEEHATQKFATDSLAFHEIQKSVVNMDANPRPQLDLRMPGSSNVYHVLDRGLERSLLGEEDTLALPESVAVEIGDLFQRVVPPRVAVTGEVSQVR